MIKHIVEVGDEFGKAFQVSVEIDYLGVITEGKWRALDKGFVRYNSGMAKKQPIPGTLTTADLVLMNFNDVWGIKLNLWDDYRGVKDYGKGVILQPWVIGIDPGPVSWAIVG